MKKKLWIVFLLNLSFTIIELVCGFIFNSYILLSDAVHDASDCLSLGSAIKLNSMSEKEADYHHPYGHKRYITVSGLFIAIVMIFSSILIFSRSFQSMVLYLNGGMGTVEIITPNSIGIIIVAILGIIINGAAYFTLQGGKRVDSKALHFHMLEDVLGWVAVLLLGALMYFTGWYIIDALWGIALSSFFIIRMSLLIYRDIIPVIMQSWPKDINKDELIKSIEAQGCTVEVIEAWTLVVEEYVLDLKISVDSKSDPKEIIKKIRNILPVEIKNSTIEVI